MEDNYTATTVENAVTDTPQGTANGNTKAKKPLTKIIDIVIVIIAVVTLVNVFGGNIFKSKNDIAIGCAKTLISQQLKAPSSAKWHNCKVIDKDSYGKYLVYIKVEATNSFGGYVTNEYLVVVKDIQRNGEFRYNTSFAVQSVEPEFYDSVLEATKTLNGWNENV